MNNSTLYNLVHTILKKETKGRSITPDRFTYLLQQCHLEYYSQQYEKWAGSQTLLDSLKPFLVVDGSFTFSAASTAISQLSNTYKHLVAARMNSTDYKIEIVTPAEWNEWTDDVVMQGTSRYPIMTVDNSNFIIAPYSAEAQGIKVSYLVDLDGVKFASGTTTSTTSDRLVDSTASFTTTVEVGMTVYNTTDSTTATISAINSATNLQLSSDIMTSGEAYVIIQDDDATDFILPYFDYYIDSNKNVQYLTNGQSITLTSSDTYRDGTAGDGSTVFVGTSHELKWKDGDKMNILSLILEKIGVSLSSMDISQYAMAKEQQQNVM